MNFIESIIQRLTSNPDYPMITEMLGERPIPVASSKILELIGRGRTTLDELGVTAGDRVVLLAPNSHRWVAADLSILSAGAIVVPMYARQNPAELVEMMHDCEPKAVVVASPQLGKAITEVWPEAPITTFSAFFDSEASTHPPVERNEDSEVTIIYTSGSTGSPKGVVTTIGNTDFMLGATRQALENLLAHNEHAERMFHYLPFCFAGSRITLWTQLLRGIGLVISTDLNALIDELKGAQPTYFLNVPMLLERIKNGVEAKIREKPAPVQWLYDAGKKGFMRMSANEARPGDALAWRLSRKVILRKIRMQIGPKLQCLICGSAPLGEDTQRWFEMLEIPVYQIYGLTETTAIVTIDHPDKVTPGRVGPAINGIETKLGEGEELLVRGPNIFARYWNRPESTAAAFVDGWFRTGDRADIDAHGNWRIVGRVKNLLVPTSGHNVAPEPIEQQLVETIEGVEHAVLIGHARPFITAIITGETTAAALEEGVELVNKGLPHYRRIRTFHHSKTPFTIENGLLTANQKIRRNHIEKAYSDQVEAMYS
jgi:long-chain acyl-CoA synthetase